MRKIQQTEMRRAIGFAIRKHREAYGLTKEKLAEHSDIHRTYLADIERGARNPSIETIRRLCSGLGILPSQLFQTVEASLKLYQPHSRATRLAISNGTQAGRLNAAAGD
jgi:transcriptional regulator with XRE-family HTH domain